MYSQNFPYEPPPVDPSLDDNFDLDSDSISLDLDNDGTLETIAQGIDTDGDNLPDTWLVQSDINNDGIADETFLIQGLDNDNDGQIDVWQIQTDTDGNGIPDDISQIDNTADDVQLDTLGNEIGSEDAQIVGEPEDTTYWHQQAYQDTCAVSAQEFILDELTGQDFTEDQLRQEAYDNGWYTPGGGTSMECVGNLLEAHGIDVERETGCTWDDLNQKLAEGQHVIVGVDAEKIWYPDRVDEDDFLYNSMGMPGQGANHAVQVIGIDNSDPNNSMVILNDPGTPDGQGLRVPADGFINAWEDSDNFMVSTTGQAVQTDQQQVMQPTALGGYYNANGSYHWTSYGVDTWPPDT